MKSGQGVCASTSEKAGLRSRWEALLQALALLAMGMLFCAGISHAQGVNTATLAGTIMDPSGGALRVRKSR